MSSQTEFIIILATKDLIFWDLISKRIQSTGENLAERVSDTRGINSAIRRQLEKSKVVKIGDAEKGGLAGQDSIAVGLSSDAEILVVGDAGDYFGAYNNGAVITLTGTAGRYLGDSMSRGGIILKGRARHGVGVYMTGGIIVVKGGVEGDCGQFNSGGTIIVNGKVGDNVGAYMNSGTIIVTGTAGKNVGNWMVGGEIYLGSGAESAGENVAQVELTEKDIEKLKKYFGHYGIIYDKLEDYTRLVPKDSSPFVLTSFYQAGGSE
jgi:glutamate synthase domain-containing protein 3